MKNFIIFLTFSMSLDFMEKRFCALSPSSLSVPFNPIKILSKPIAGFVVERIDHIGNFLATFSGNNLVKVLETPAQSNLNLLNNWGGNKWTDFTCIGNDDRRVNVDPRIVWRMNSNSCRSSIFKQNLLHICVDHDATAVLLNDGNYAVRYFGWSTNREKCAFIDWF